MHIQSRLESFQTVKTHYYIAYPKHLNFVSFLGYSLLLGGDQPQTQSLEKSLLWSKYDVVPCNCST